MTSLKRSASVDNAAERILLKRQRRLSTPLASTNGIDNPGREVPQAGQSGWDTLTAVEGTSLSNHTAAASPTLDTSSVEESTREAVLTATPLVCSLPSVDATPSSTTLVSSTDTSNTTSVMNVAATIACETANQPGAHENLVLPPLTDALPLSTVAAVSEMSVDTSTEVTSTSFVSNEPAPIELDSSTTAPDTENENVPMEITPVETETELASSVDPTPISTSGTEEPQSSFSSPVPILPNNGIEVPISQLHEANDITEQTLEMSLPLPTSSSLLPAIPSPPAPSTFDIPQTADVPPSHISAILESRLPMLPDAPSTPTLQQHFPTSQTTAGSLGPVSALLESQQSTLPDSPCTPTLQQHQFSASPIQSTLPLAAPSPATSTPVMAMEEVTPPIAPLPPPLTIVTTTGRKRGSNASGGDQQPSSATSTPTSASAAGGKRSRNGKQPKSKTHVTPSPPMSPAPYPNPSAVTTPSAGVGFNNICVPATAITTRRRKSKHTVSETTPVEDSRNTVTGDRADEEELYCTCRRPYDPAKFMICCDGCDDWFHGTCVDVSEEAGELVDKYYCPGCSAKGRTSSWKSKCFRNGCSRPALVPVSKYCSQQCGIRVAEELLKQQDERVRRIKGRKERKGLNDEGKRSRSRKASGRIETGKEGEVEAINSNEDVGSANQENVRVKKETEGDSEHLLSQGEASRSTSEPAVPRERSESEGKFLELDEEARGSKEQDEGNETSKKRKRKCTGEGEHFEGDDNGTATGIVKGGMERKGRNRDTVLSTCQDSPRPSCDSPGGTWHSSPSSRSGSSSTSRASPSPSHFSTVSACGFVTGSSSPPPPPITAADRDDHARLQTLEELKNAAREAIANVRKRSKFLEGAIDRARKTRTQGEAEAGGEDGASRRVCGFDVRLVWGDGRAEAAVVSQSSPDEKDGIRKRRKLEDGSFESEGTSDSIGAGSEDEVRQEERELNSNTASSALNTSSSSFSDEVCLLPVENGEKGGLRLVCEKHFGWENLKKAELENEMRLQTSALSRLQEEEKQVLARLHRRRNDHLAATSLNGTIEH